MIPAISILLLIPVKTLLECSKMNVSCIHFYGDLVSIFLRCPSDLWTQFYANIRIFMFQIQRIVLALIGTTAAMGKYCDSKWSDDASPGVERCSRPYLGNHGGVRLYVRRLSTGVAYWEVKWEASKKITNRFGCQIGKLIQCMEVSHCKHTPCCKHFKFVVQSYFYDAFVLYNRFIYEKNSEKIIILVLWYCI